MPGEPGNADVRKGPDVPKPPELGAENQANRVEAPLQIQTLAAARARTQNAKPIFDTAFTLVKPPLRDNLETPNPMTLVEAETITRNITYPEPIDTDLEPLAYLIQAQDVRAKLAQASHLVTEQYQEFKLALSFAQRRFTQADSDASAWDKSGFWKKLFSMPTKGRIVNEKNIALADYNEFAKKQQEEEELSKRAKTALSNVQDRQSAFMDRIIVNEASGIRGGYQELFEQIRDDPQILKEVRYAYLDRTIYSKLREKVVEGTISQEQADAFSGAVESLFRKADEQGFSWRQHEGKDEAWELTKADFHFTEFSEQLKDLMLPGKYENLLGLVVGDLAARDMQGLIQHMVESPSSADSSYLSKSAATIRNGFWLSLFSESNNSNILNFNTLDAAHTDTRRDGGNKLYNIINSENLWESFKASPRLQNILGEQFREVDQMVYERILFDSLSDDHGAVIDRLANYPVPDAIRNLVLIAAADNKEYRTVHANWVINEITHREDWPQLFEAAVAQYPELKKMESVLANWSVGMPSAYQTNQELAGNIDDFAMSIAKNPDKYDHRLVKLALESIPESTLMDILINQKNLFTEDDLVRFKDSVQILKSRSQLGSTLGSSAYYLLERDLRQLFIRLSVGQEVLGDQNRLQYLIGLSKEIIKNGDNIEALTYLGSQDVLVVADNNYTAEARELIYGLWKTAPNLVKPENSNLLIEALNDWDSIVRNKADIKLLDEFSQNSAFSNPENLWLKQTVLKRWNLFIKDKSDVTFFGRVIGEFGKKAQDIIKGYQECLVAGTVTTSDKDLVLEFARQFRSISPHLLAAYKEAKQSGYEKVYIAQLTQLAERMTGAGTITDEDRAKPFYNDLLHHVYPANAGHYSSYESNATCSDRSSDLAEFSIKPRYEIDLLSQSEIRVKEGQELDKAVQQAVQDPVYAVAAKMGEAGYDNEKVKVSLDAQIAASLKQIIETGGLTGVDLNALKTPEERLFLILTDSIYGSKTVDPKSVKDLLITYEFANFEDVRDYINGTNDRVGRSSNRDYALLCEVETFYSDRIKEVNRKIVEAGFSNPEAAKIMPQYFTKLAEEAQSADRQDKINRLNINRLGLSDSFVAQAAKILERRSGKKYTQDQVREIIRRYEHATGGLTEESSTSENPQTKAFYGQLRNQREKTADALRLISGEELDVATLNLGEVDFKQLLELEANMREGIYDEDQFASFTVQKFIDLFADERNKIQGELDKFESDSGKEREVLYGYFSKTKETANARMVGGVCVSGDNPIRGPQNTWDMPNYFQLVLQDPDTLQSQGLVLLHHFEQDGKKVLSASLNPSQTYLYSVDEVALFKGLMGTLEDFAANNGFDMITTSKNRTIRTNRTGGKFENAMDQRVRDVGTAFTFDSLRQFSFNPNYQLEEMDVVWENNKAG